MFVLTLIFLKNGTFKMVKTGKEVVIVKVTDVSTQTIKVFSLLFHVTCFEWISVVQY